MVSGVDRIAAVVPGDLQALVRQRRKAVEGVVLVSLDDVDRHPVRPENLRFGGARLEPEQHVPLNLERQMQVRNECW